MYQRLCVSSSTVQCDQLSGWQRCQQPAGETLRGAFGCYNSTNTRIQAFYFSDVFTSQTMNNSIKTRVLQVKHATHAADDDQFSRSSVLQSCCADPVWPAVCLWSPAFLLHCLELRLSTRSLFIEFKSKTVFHSTRLSECLREGSAFCCLNWFVTVHTGQMWTNSTSPMKMGIWN